MIIQNMFKVTLAVCITISVLISCGKNSPTAPEASISDYVELTVSGGEPAFILLKESALNHTATYSNLRYNNANQVTSYHVLIEFPESSGNTYDIQVSDIKRDDFFGNATAYNAAIVATVGGERISGTLTYP